MDLKKYAMLFALSIIPAVVTANPQANSTHMIVAPKCLLKHSSLAANPLASSKTLLLIRTDEKGMNALQKARFSQTQPCGGFMDVTQAWHDYKRIACGVDATAFLKQYEMKSETELNIGTKKEYQIRYENQVNTLLKQINPTSMWNYLTTLTNFVNRHADSDTGVEASNWIKTQVEKMASDNHRDDVEVYTVRTGNQNEGDDIMAVRNYRQNSVVAKIGKGDGPGIVIGAHMDTLALFGNLFFENRQPGADDDGSGSATALETIRTILYSGMKFQKPIYFIWYAAEEEGLVGSQYVVSAFKKEGRKVDAVLHFDMTGYAHRNDPTMWLISDFTDKDLTTFLKNLIEKYVKQPYKYTRCGYACSDHATWNKNGFPAAISFESSFENANKSIHSSRDTMEKLSQQHMTDYVKLGVAFAVELAEPQS